jgi:hypothetical protein
VSNKTARADVNIRTPIEVINLLSEAKRETNEK